MNLLPVFFRSSFKRMGDYLVDHRARIILAFSARAGATIAAMMFFRCQGRLEEALAYSRWIHDYRLQVYYPENPVSRKLLKDPRYFRFKIVRDPFERIVSSYLMIFGNRRLLYTLGIEKTDMSFADFIDWLGFQDIRGSNPHIALQCDPDIRDPGIFHHVCRLEQLEDDLEEVRRCTGIAFSARGLKTPHRVRRHRRAEANVLHCPWPGLKNRIPEYDHFYDKAYREKVFQLYSDDFRAYYPELEP